MEPAGRGSEPAGRGSDPAGRNLKPGERALESAGRVSEPAGGGRRQRERQNRAFLVYGGTIGYRPPWGRCPKTKTDTGNENVS